MLFSFAKLRASVILKKNKINIYQGSENCVFESQIENFLLPWVSLLLPHYYQTSLDFGVKMEFTLSSLILEIRGKKWQN